MKKTLIFCIAFLITPILITSQTIGIYKPDGTGIPVEKNITVGELHRLLDPRGETVEYTAFIDPDGGEITIIHFKFLTDIPIFVETSEPKYIERRIINFNLEKYYHSAVGEIEINKRIKSKKLTDLYLINNLRKPTRKYKDTLNGRTFELWEYISLGLTFKILNGYVVGYISTE